LADSVGESGWTHSIDDQKFRESFKKLILIKSLAKSVMEQDNEDAVHLIVIASGSYQQAGQAEEHDESRDIVAELAEIRRVLFLFLLFVSFSDTDTAIGYRAILESRPR